jgi:ribosomal protein S27E
VSAPALVRPDTDHDDRRCRRGAGCVRREKRTTLVEAECPCSCHGGGQWAACDATSDDGGCGHLHTTTEEVTLHGKLLDDPATGWCPPCISRLELALDELPALAELLDQLHEPTLEIRYRTDDCGGGGNPHPAIPLNEHSDALTRLIDHELATNAELVADAAGVDWDSQAAAAQRPASRIFDASRLLRYRIVQWLALPEQEYEARSLTADPRDGHDLDALDFVFGRWWVRRDGPAAAGEVLKLHRQALHFTGGAASDWVPVPCGHCGDRALYRQHTACTVRCRACGDTKSDDGHDAFLDAALAAHTTGATR